MNKKRLIKAYSILKTIPAGNLDLKTWKMSGQYFKNPTCNTIACAAGWLAMHPDFNEMGLGSEKYGCPVYRKPGKEVKTAYEAMADLFSISKRESERLFQPALNRENRNDKRTVLRRFQRFFAENGIVA